MSGTLLFFFELNYDLHLSEFGIDLGQVSFQAFYQGIFLGREYFPCLTKSLVVIDLWSAALAASQVMLNPLAVTHTHFTGRIVPQSDNDLETLGQLFSQFLMGHNLTLTAKGGSVRPPGVDEPIAWLSAAFQTLELNITLPGQQLNVIKAIKLDDLEITMQEQDQTFAPPVSSKRAAAQYANPFGFSLQAVESAQKLVLNVQGTDVAEVGCFFCFQVHCC